MAGDRLLLQEGFRPLFLTEGAERPSMGQDSLFEYTLQDNEFKPGELNLMERKIHTNNVPNGKDKFTPTDMDWLRGQTKDVHAKVNRTMEGNTEGYDRPRTDGSLALKPVPKPMVPARPEHKTEVIDLSRQFEEIGKKKGIARRHVKPKEVAQAAFYGALLGIGFKIGDFVRSTFFPSQSSGDNPPVVVPAERPIAEISPVPPFGTSTEAPPLPTLTVTQPPSETPPSGTPTERVPTQETITIPESIDGNLLYVERRSDGGRTAIVNGNKFLDIKRFTGEGPLSTPNGREFFQGFISQGMEELLKLSFLWNSPIPETPNKDVFFWLTEIPPELLDDQPDGVTDLDIIHNTGFTSNFVLDEESGKHYQFHSMFVDEIGNTILVYATNGYPENSYRKYAINGRSRELIASKYTAGDLIDLAVWFREVARNGGRPFTNIGSLNARGIYGPGGKLEPLTDTPGNLSLDDFWTPPNPSADTPDFEFEEEPVLQ